LRAIPRIGGLSRQRKWIVRVFEGFQGPKSVGVAGGIILTGDLIPFFFPGVGRDCKSVKLLAQVRKNSDEDCAGGGKITQL